MAITRLDAISELYPNTNLAYHPENKICVIDGEEVEDYTSIDNKVVSMQVEYDAQAYARNRQPEYPSTGDQLDMIYKDTKNSTTTHADAVEVVKTKWPKDNSGPV